MFQNVVGTAASKPVKAIPTVKNILKNWH